MTNKSQIKTTARIRRHNRLRQRVVGTAVRPRLSVFKSNTAVYAQLIDDTAGKTLLAVDSRKQTTGTKLESAKAIGVLIAKKAVEANIKAVVFDRGGFRYQGIIASVAEGAREGGLAL